MPVVLEQWAYFLEKIQNYINCTNFFPIMFCWGHATKLHHRKGEKNGNNSSVCHMHALCNACSL